MGILGIAALVGVSVCIGVWLGAVMSRRSRRLQGEIPEVIADRDDADVHVVFGGSSVSSGRITPLRLQSPTLVRVARGSVPPPMSPMSPISPMSAMTRTMVGELIIRPSAVPRNDETPRHRPRAELLTRRASSES